MGDLGNGRMSVGTRGLFTIRLWDPRRLVGYIAQEAYILDTTRIT